MRLSPPTLGAMPPPADIVKVAIEWPGAFPKLMEIDQVCASVQQKTPSSHQQTLLSFKSSTTSEKCLGSVTLTVQI